MGGEEQQKEEQLKEEQQKHNDNNDNGNKTTGQEQTKVDETKVREDAVQDYLKGLGYDDETLKGIVAKHKEDEEKNSTELEKVQSQLTKATKELVEERAARAMAEAKLAAIKMGAVPSLVDDLVTIATSRVTKDKKIDAIIAEIKAGENGSVYFQKEEEETDKKNLTGGTTGTGGKKKAESDDDDFIKRMKEQRAATGGKSSFWGKRK